jgi:aldehyde dehydrogenase (NAD+)
MAIGSDRRQPGLLRLVADPGGTLTLDAVDSGTEQLFFRVAEAQEPDIRRAVTAAREAFDEGPWPRLSHIERRAEVLRAIAVELTGRADDIGQIWPRESGVLHGVARHAAVGAAATFDY